jgi:hypothetical protein
VPGGGGIWAVLGRKALRIGIERKGRPLRPVTESAINVQPAGNKTPTIVTRQRGEPDARSLRVD